jgi:hypothetical protein
MPRGQWSGPSTPRPHTDGCAVRRAIRDPGQVRRQGRRRHRCRPGDRPKGGRAHRRRRRRVVLVDRADLVHDVARGIDEAAKASGSGGSATSVTADLETFAGATQAVKAALAGPRARGRPGQQRGRHHLGRARTRSTTRTRSRRKSAARSFPRSGPAGQSCRP